MRLEAILEERASALGNQPFMIDTEGRITLSYSRFLAAARAAAHRLAALGIRPGDRVALLAADRLRFWLWIFGIVGCGAVAVPLDPALPETGLRFLLSFTEASAVIADATRYPAVASLAGEIPPLRETLREEDLPLDPAAVPASFPVTGMSDEESAVILFTSGSTGNPKGVMLSHRALAWNCEMAGDRKRTACRRTLNGLPPHTLFGFCGLTLLPMWCGGTVLHHPGWNAYTLPSFWDIAAAYRAAFFGVIPAHVAMLVRLNRYDPSLDLSGLEFGLSASAPLSAALQRRFEEQFHCPLAMSYGMTEGTTFAYASPFLLPRKYGSVGRPWGCDLEIVDEQEGVLPPGEVGEVRVRSRRLMTGYFKNPGATAEVLRDGWLYTGDLGRMDADGDLFLVGRKKDMVIRNGMKVYLNEIDEVLSSHPGIVEAATIAEATSAGQVELRAFVVPMPGAVLREEDVREFAGTRLPGHKCPTRIAVVSTLPKGGTGKILRGCLERA